MDQKERQVLVTMLATMLIFTVYALYVYNHYIADDPDIINNYRFWGRTLLFLVPVAIVLQIIIHILYAIMNRIITHEDVPHLDDERDRLIELKSIRISHWIFTIGFSLAMGALAIDLKPWVMFVTLIGSGFLASIIAEAAKLYYYMKGV